MQARKYGYLKEGFFKKAKDCWGFSFFRAFFSVSFVLGALNIEIGGPLMKYQLNLSNEALLDTSAKLF